MLLLYFLLGNQLFNLHLDGFFLHLYALLLLGTWIGIFFDFAFPGLSPATHALFELPTREGASFLVFVDDEPRCCYLETKFLDGLTDGHALFEHKFDQQHSFLDDVSGTFMGILEYFLLLSSSSSIRGALILLL